MEEFYFDKGFHGTQFFILMIFLIILGIILFRVVANITQWHHNNKQPILTVHAKVVTKRSSVSSHHHNHNGHGHISSNTSYYVTFEKQNGNRLELHVSGKEYGLLAEGDQGTLTYQGTRYHSFERY